VVGIMERHDTATIPTEPTKGAVEHAQLIEVDAREEDAVLEPVFARRAPVVHHPALVQA
jgi:hypothetical protein